MSLNKDKILITTYENPDLDGFSCTYAYAEFLNKKDIRTQPVVFGIPDREVKFVLNKFGIDNLDNGDNYIDNIDGVILTDTSNIRDASDKISPDKVVEIIDHRKVCETDKLPKAKIQIELVGAAATLVAERFLKEDVDISRESAILLYSAIVSNTINFKNNVTTDRDIKTANWLKEKVNLPEEYIYEMFEAKSDLSDIDVKEVFLSDFKAMELIDKKMSIAQLEIVKVEEYVNKNLKEIILALEELKQEKNVDYIFLTCIDLYKGFNLFVVAHEEMQKILTEILNIDFENNMARQEGIIMRKELFPLIKDYLEKQKTA